MSEPLAPAPANPPVTPEESDDTPRIQINFPAFDVFLARQQQTNGKVMRSITDKTHDFAQIRDVNNVAEHACRVAAVAISAYNEVMHPLYTSQIQHLANTTAWAIKESIAELEYNRRANAWYRKLWRRIRRQPFPERRSTQLPA